MPEGPPTKESAPVLTDANRPPPVAEAKRLPWDTLRGRLLFVLALTNLPLIAITLGLAIERAEYDREQAERGLRSEVRQASGSLKEVIEGVRQLLFAISHSPSIRGKDAVRCALFLKSMQPRIGDRYTNIWFADADGRPVCSMAPMDPKLRFDDREWFREARETRDFSMGKIVEVFGSGQHVVSASYPVVDEGRLVGVVGAALRVTWLAGTVTTRTAAGDQVTITFMDGKGEVIMPDKSHSAQGLLPATRLDPSQARGSIIEAMGRDRQPHIYVLERLFADDLFMVGIAPANTLYGRALEAFSALIVPVILIVVVTFAVVGIGVYRSVLQPLAAFAEAVRAYRAGDFTIRPNPGRAPSEIHDLAAQFGKMARAIAQRERRLERVIAHRDALIAEIHHRVKNNLQMVASLLSLQAGRVRSDEAREALNSARRRVLSLSVLHKHLFERDDVENVDVGKFLDDLCVQLRGSHVGSYDARIRIVCECDPLILPTRDAIALGLIVTEAITNATKYAFPGRRGGIINVVLTVREERVRLSIKDDGIGGPGEGDAALSGGLGRSLMDGLAGQLAGNLSIKHEQGTEVVVEFAIDRATQLKSKAIEPAPTEE
ncbi:MAG TPA: histidine kinase dimerization/phosphoacceptor domain -containing protein [Alphaproteobacteria bacterium]|jgi:two-component sensor histidine kinase